jgi:integrase
LENAGMANIQKRISQDGKSTNYRVRVRLKGYPLQTATFERLTDARRWAQQTESAIREGRHFKTTEAKRHTLAELVDRYIRDVLPNKGAGTATDQTRQLHWWKEQLGVYALSDVSPSLIAEYRDKLLNGISKRQYKRSPSTVNRYLAVLSHAFTIAVKEWQWLEDNPLRKVSKPKEPRGRVRFLSDEEREKLLAACKEGSNPDLYLAVVLALSTGARQAEIMTLRWQQVNLAAKVIRLEHTKNGERRVLPLVEYALELMRERTKVRRIDTDLIFPSRVDPTKSVDLRAPWEAALKRADIADFRWHDLRHSTASYLAMNGASLAEIAEVLGHKTLQMVKRYAHLSEQHVAGVVAKMNRHIFGGQS